LSNKTILFADDSATMRAIVEKTFLAEPFDVVSVPSGEGAIAKAKEIRPDVMIVDVGLAGVTGYDVCQAVRNDSALSDTPFVMLSGVSNIYDERRGKAVGVDEHMKKPFDTSQIIERVAELAVRPRAEKPEAPVEVEAAPEPIRPPKPAPALEPEPEEEIETIPLDESEAEAEAIPLAAAEEGYSADAMSSLGSPLDVEPTPDTKDYSRPASKPEVPRPSVPQWPEPELGIGEEQPLGEEEPEVPIPEVEPIEIKPKPAEPISASFQVGTLAELAQMDNRGTPLKVETDEEAIELEPVSPKPEAVQAVSAKLEPVKERIESAATQVASSVPGVSAEQLAAIQLLTVEVIERVVWDVVPDLAETIIKEELAKLLKE
jgi:DNA-binding response OmpR family regulator